MQKTGRIIICPLSILPNCFQTAPHKTVHQPVETISWRHFLPNGSKPANPRHTVGSA